MRTNDYDDFCKEIESFKEVNFSKHILTIKHESDSVCCYQFRQRDTGCYGFNLVTSDNLIQMNGDCYSLTVHPGYGRKGLAFLRGAIDSYQYFLEKVPDNCRESLTEYSYDEVENNLKEMADSYDVVFDDEWMHGLDDGELHSMPRYYELCYEQGFDEPYSPKVYTRRTVMQLAGLKAFVEAYNKSDGIYK